ncbi:MAG TPA: putative protein N(5)-glutamine methyltransferase [Pseudonocardiaceae bacterium]
MSSVSSVVVGRLRAAGCVFAEDEARLLAEAGGDLEDLVARRVAGEPLEQVLGWAAFRGLRIAVEPGVFVPRRRTELLVRLGIPLVRAGSVVVELCCGAGAVAAALAATVPGLEVHAADVDPVAVRCARRNVPGAVYEGDLDAPLPESLRGRVGLLVANAPYVPSAAVPLMPPEARLHEPLTALDGGPDGLTVLRRVVALAPAWLAPGGHLVVESSAAQAPALAAAATAAGLTPVVHEADDLGATAVLCRS